MTAPILFLDIDGVLNSGRSAIALGGMPHGLAPEQLAKFDQVALGLVRRLCADTGCQIVVSSSWRRLHGWRDIGAALGLPVVGDTPQLNNVPRGGEIAAWMEQNGTPGRWAIVDDDSDMLPEQMSRFVQTDFNNGIGWEQYVQLAELLG